MAGIGRWNIASATLPRSPRFPFRCIVLEFVIEQAAFCALIGFVLSVVVAMAASRPVRVEPQSILTRLALAAAPAYLAVDYLVYQGLAMVIIAAGACCMGLCCFRGWWLPQPPLGAAAERRRAAARSRQAVLLRYRVEAVIRADRRYPYPSTNGRPAKAA